MAEPTLDDIQDDAPTIWDYIDNMSSSYKGGFVRMRSNYVLNIEALEKLRGYKDDYVFVGVFADWCGDARKAIPVLALLERELDIEIRALGGMTKPGWGSGSNELWAVPPSPLEVATFDITSSPTIFVFNKTGEEVGRIKTKPKITPTIEEELVKIIEDNL
ncbi:MAG: thioredoxin family protein [Candidatus Thorarchaeota archaeon]